MVFQHFNLFPHLSILENIVLAPTDLGRLSKDEAEKKALELLERVGLADKKMPIQILYLVVKNNVSQLHVR